MNIKVQVQVGWGREWGASCCSEQAWGCGVVTFEERLLLLKQGLRTVVRVWGWSQFVKIYRLRVFDYHLRRLLGVLEGLAFVESVRVKGVKLGRGAVVETCRLLEVSLRRIVHFYFNIFSFKLRKKWMMFICNVYIYKKYKFISK